MKETGMNSLLTLTRSNPNHYCVSKTSGFDNNDYVGNNVAAIVASAKNALRNSNLSYNFRGRPTESKDMFTNDLMKGGQKWNMEPRNCFLKSLSPLFKKCPVTMENIQRHQANDMSLVTARFQRPNLFPVILMENTYIIVRKEGSVRKIVLPESLLPDVICWYRFLFGQSCEQKILLNSIQNRFWSPFLSELSDAEDSSLETFEKTRIKSSLLDKEDKVREGNKGVEEKTVRKISFESEDTSVTSKSSDEKSLLEMETIVALSTRMMSVPFTGQKTKKDWDSQSDASSTSLSSCSIDTSEKTNKRKRDDIELNTLSPKRNSVKKGCSSPNTPYNDEKWESQFQLLKKYKQEHGSVLVPTNHPKLGRWVDNQRQEFKKNRLTEYRIECLNSVGFAWACFTSPKKAWEERFELFKNFKKDHGSVLVPEKHPELGQWVRKQRESYRKKRLSEYRIERLNSVGFVWSCLTSKKKTWEENFELLKEYKKKHDSVLVPQKHPELGNWVSRQRKNYKKKLLSEYRIDCLNSIGFVWSCLTFK